MCDSQGHQSMGGWKWEGFARLGCLERKTARQLPPPSHEATRVRTALFFVRRLFGTISLVGVWVGELGEVGWGRVFKF